MARDAISGIAHIVLTVGDLDRSRAFYDPILRYFGMEPVFDGDDFVYWVGGKTAIGLQPCEAAYQGERFAQYRVGLHHLCFRARSREDVDAAGRFLSELGVTVVRGPTEGGWAPGYYYVLFEDLDGIRLELCHVPGKGVFEEDVGFDPGSDFHYSGAR